MKKVEIVAQSIPIKLYQNMRVKCGLSFKTEQACAIGLKNSLYSIVVKDEEEIIGMGRVVGDGGCFCQVVDICVLPNRQGRGIGKLIMENIVNYIKKQLPPSCYVSLIADGDASFLYEKFGFQNTMPESRGMYLKNP